MSTLADLMVKIGVDDRGVDKGAKGVESKLKKTWGGIKAGAATAGLAAGAALMAGLQSMVEQSKPIALLQAQLGATGEFAGDIGEAAGKLYARGVVGSMDEAAAAIKAVWQNGLVDEDATNAEIEAVGAKLSNLALIAEDEAGNVSNAVKQMMRNGLIKNVEEGFDLLTRGVQEGVNKSGDLFDTYNEYGTQFRKLGLDGATSMGLMNQAIRAGARDADTAADALKEFSIRAIDGSKASAAGYEALGLNAEKMAAQIAKGGPAAEAGLSTVLEKLKAMKDPVKQNAAAVGLFGTKAEDLGAALFAMDVDSAAAGLGDVAGAADKAGKTLEESAGAKLEAFKRTVQAALVEKLAEAVPYIEKTFGWLKDNSGWVVPLATGLAILAAVIGTIVLATKVWTAVQTAFNIVMALNPVTLIVIGILLLIGVIVLVATKTQFFQTIWAAVWGFLKAVGAWFAGPFKNFFVSTWKAITNAAVTAWNWIKSTGLSFWNWIKSVPGWIRDKWNAMWTAVKTAGGTAWTWIKTKALSFYNWVIGIPGKISNKLRSMWDGLKTGFRAAANWLIGKWNNLSFTIGGGSFLGQNIPSLTLSTPDIPYLKDGGIVPATPGGRLAVIGEGGEDEAVMPLSKIPQVAGGGRQTVIEFQGSETEFIRFFRKSLRVREG